MRVTFQKGAELGRVQLMLQIIEIEDLFVTTTSTTGKSQYILVIIGDIIWELNIGTSRKRLFLSLLITR